MPKQVEALPQPTCLGETGGWHYYAQAGDVYRRQNSNGRPAYYCQMKNWPTSTAGRAIAEQAAGARDVELR